MSNDTEGVRREAKGGKTIPNTELQTSSSKGFTPLERSGACPASAASAFKFGTSLPMRRVQPFLTGFTLLEVLLALVILAIVITSVYMSFSTSSRNVENAETRRNMTDLARTLISKLSDDIANAYYNAGMKTIFYGKKEEVGGGNDKRRLDSIFLTPLTNWRKPDSKETDLCEVGYFFREKPQGEEFVMLRREKRELTQDTVLLEGGTEYDMTDNIRDFQLRYRTGSQTWSDGWDSRTTRKLPSFVEVRILFTDGSLYIAEVEIKNGQ